MYQAVFNIKSEDFQLYTPVLTETPIVAYSWEIDRSALATFPLSKTAYLRVTLPDGRTFNESVSFSY